MRFLLVTLSLSILLLVFPVDDIYAFDGGMVYSPVKKGAFFEDIVKDDISIISSFTENIRLYKIDENTAKILENAKEQGLTVTLGIDLQHNNSEDKTKQYMQKAAEFAKNYPGTVDSVIVGNDAIAQKQVTTNQLKEYLTFFDINEIPVTSANSPYIWQENPSLADKVDYILLYSFDFWEGLDPQQAAQNAILQHDKLQKLFPDKQIVLETGWPSNGNAILNAIPSEQEQSDFLRKFVILAEQRDIPYFVFEYANESWKPSKNDNTVENHWGIFSEENRMVKPRLASLFEFEPVNHIVEINEDGQAQYMPTIPNQNHIQQTILKVTIPENISGLSYQISDQELQTIVVDEKQTVLFIAAKPNQDITITTDSYSDELEFSLIPQAFAACDPDITCHQINYANYSNNDYLIYLIFASATLGIVFLVILRRYLHRTTEWDSIHIHQIN